jgi:hypothetical protein
MGDEAVIEVRASRSPGSRWARAALLYRWWQGTSEINRRGENVIR